MFVAWCFPHCPKLRVQGEGVLKVMARDESLPHRVKQDVAGKEYETSISPGFSGEDGEMDVGPTGFQRLYP
ncbi:hypothetical protein ACRALDRAFT_207800 [Sodiomyces alcalophilus JCM 7366]|uniref:uncharacterized protein n=1 Tax=Sodiomyces alcalophilus JCM 7366 TaxID=591952 RepID=UPI0039B691EE